MVVSKSIREMITSAVSNMSPCNEDFLNLLRSFGMLSNAKYLSGLNHEQLRTNSIIMVEFYQLLSKNVSSINFEDADLLKIIFGFQWQFFAEENDVIGAYSDLMLQIISFEPSRLRQCFLSLAEWLSNKRVFFDNENTLSLSANLSATIEKTHYKIHSLIEKICTLHSFSSFELVPALVHAFPFKTKSVFDFKTYVKNLLRVSSYRTELCENIVTLIFVKINELDIELSSSLKVSEDLSVLFAFMRSQLPLLDPNIAAFIESNILSEKEFEETPQTAESPCRELTEKISVAIQLLCEYLSRNKKEFSFSKKIYTKLLNTFVDEVLPTNIQRNIQFVVLFMTSMSKSFPDQLIKTLLDILTDDRKGIKGRKNSALYLASFVTSAKFVKTKVVLNILDIFLAVADCVLENYGPEKTVTFEESKYEVYALFYSICESIFHITINRFSCVSRSKLFKKRTKQLEQLLQSNLCPLQFCARNAVFSFSIFSFAAGFIDCFPMLLCHHRFFRSNMSNRLGGVFGGMMLRRKSFFVKDLALFPFADTPPLSCLEGLVRKNKDRLKKMYDDKKIKEDSE